MLHHCLLINSSEMNLRLKICTQEPYFQFYRGFYDQIYGATMYSLLGSLFANIFLMNFEEKHIDELNKLGVNKWFRYVDGVFTTLETRDCAKKILEYINKNK